MPLKSIWELDLKKNFSEKEWLRMCTDFTSPVATDIKIKESNYKFLYKYYLTPVKLNKFDEVNSPLCKKCGTELGTFMHLFWDCKVVYSFWEKIHEAIQDMCECTFDLCPRLYLLNYGLGNVFPYAKKCVFVILCHFARKCILMNWISQSGPTLSQWLDQIIHFLTMEESINTQHLKQLDVRSTWSLVHKYIDTVKLTNLS